MDTQWRSAIDRTLRSTQATLQRLQERHANYDKAKQRAHEALSLAASDVDERDDGVTAHASRYRAASSSGSNSADAGKHDGGVMHKPRPRHGSGSAGDTFVVDVDYTRPHTLHKIGSNSGSNNNNNNTSARYDNNNSSNKHATSALLYSDDTGDGGVPQTSRSAAVHRPHASAEYEGRARSSAAQARIDSELSELRHAIQQLRGENAYLTSSLHTLEAQVAFGAGAYSSSGGLYVTSRLGGDAATVASLTAQLAALRQRLGDVEARVTLQQQQQQQQQQQATPAASLLDRAQRAEAVLRPLVTAAVSAEVERVRAVAREAARAHVDGAVAARVSSATAAAEAEWQRTTSAASVAAERVALLERQLQHREQTMSRQLARLEAAVQQLSQQQQKQQQREGDSEEDDNRASNSSSRQDKQRGRVEALTASVRALEQRCGAVERDVRESRVAAAAADAAQRAQTHADLLTAVDEAVARRTCELASEATVMQRVDAAVQRVEQRVTTAMTTTTAATAADVATCTAAVAQLRQQLAALQAQASQQCDDVAARTRATCAQTHDALLDEVRALRTRLDTLTHTSTSIAAAAEHARARARSAATMTAASDENDRVVASEVVREQLCKHEAQLQTLRDAQSGVRGAVDDARQRCHALEARLQQQHEQQQQLYEQHARQQQQLLQHALRQQQQEQAASLSSLVDGSVARALQPLSQSVHTLEAALTQRCEEPLRSLAADVQRTSERLRQLQTRVHDVEAATASQLHDAQAATEARAAQLERVLRQAAATAQRECAQHHDACTAAVATLREEVYTQQQQQQQQQREVAAAAAAAAVATLPSVHDVHDAVRSATHALVARLDVLDAAARRQQQQQQQQQHALTRRCHARAADVARLRAAVRELHADGARQARALTCGQARVAWLERRAAAAAVQQTQQLQHCLAAVDECKAHVTAAAQLLQTRMATSTADTQRALQQLRDEQAAQASSLQRLSSQAGAGHHSGGGGGGAAASAAEATRAEEQQRALVTRLGRVEATTEQGLLAMADTLSSLRDGLQACVACARATLQRHDGGAGGADGNDDDDNDDDDDVQGAVSSATRDTADNSPQQSPSQPAQTTTSSLQSLEDVFAFVVEHVCLLRSGAAALQANALATLELIQQQEVDLAAIAPLQRAVLQLSFALTPVARAVGVDPALFRVQLPPLGDGSSDTATTRTASDTSSDEDGSSSSSRGRRRDRTRTDDGDKDAAVVVGVTVTSEHDSDGGEEHVA